MEKLWDLQIVNREKEKEEGRSLPLLFRFFASADYSALAATT